MYLVEEACGPCARLGVLVPVPAVGQVHALRGLQAQRVDVVDEDQQAGQLHRLGDAELVGRLDRVDGVAAGVGQAQDLRLAGLRLQQEGREVAGRQRVLDGADDGAAGGLDDGGRCRPAARRRRHSRPAGSTRSCRRPSPPRCRCPWPAPRCRRPSARCRACTGRWSAPS